MAFLGLLNNSQNYHFTEWLGNLRTVELITIKTNMHDVHVPPVQQDFTTLTEM